jgi:hypothetical protein
VNIYADTISLSGLTNAWQLMGTWTPANPAPTVVSLIPSSGSGSSQTFSFVFSDPAGYQDMAWQQVIVNSPSDGCYIDYVPSSNMVNFYNNGGWLGPQALGSPGILQNNQCSLNVGASSASGTGTNLTLRLALSFQGSLTGAVNIYADTISLSGLTNAWQLMGTWTP